MTPKTVIAGKIYANESEKNYKSARGIPTLE
jgi:hypothetical protein